MDHNERINKQILMKVSIQEQKMLVCCFVYSYRTGLSNKIILNFYDNKLQIEKEEGKGEYEKFEMSLEITRNENKGKNQLLEENIKVNMKSELEENEERFDKVIQELTTLKLKVKTEVKTILTENDGSF